MRVLSTAALGQGGTSWNQMRQAGAHCAIEPAQLSRQINGLSSECLQMLDWSPGIMEAGLRHGDSGTFLRSCTLTWGDECRVA